MTTPFATLESLDNGIVVRYLTCVEKERQVSPSGIPASFDQDVLGTVKRILPSIVALARAEGLIAPDEREPYEVAEAAIKSEAPLPELPPSTAKTEKYLVLEPVAQFVADSDHGALIEALLVARAMHEKAQREGAILSHVYGVGGVHRAFGLPA